MYPQYFSPYSTINTSLNLNPRSESNWFALEILLRSKCSKHHRDFFYFIREMYDRFEKIRLGMSYTNTDASHHQGDDTHTAGWAGIGMMPIAIYLYYLKSYGVQGKVLECGVFKGGSTCCLSHICDYLDLELIAADSFEGLPFTNGYYGKGDFKGSYEEVSANIERLGKPEVVTLVKGWFNESLRSFDDDLMLIWLDVDLKQSVLDVLNNTYSNLVQHGVIFCDGLGEHRDFKDDHLIPASSESSGLLEFFNQHNISHKAKYSGFGHMGLVLPNIPKDEKLIYSHRQITRMISAAMPLSHKLEIAKIKLRRYVKGQ